MAAMIGEVVRCCLTSMNEHDGLEVRLLVMCPSIDFAIPRFLSGTPFTLVELPVLLWQLVSLGTTQGSLSQGQEGQQGPVHKGLQLLLEQSTLLDMKDAR